MFETLKETWKKIQQDPPGKRFRRQYRRRQSSRDSIAKRALFIGAGLVLLCVGLIMLFTPGPGLLFFFLGWGLIAQESLFLAKILDKLEVFLRRWADWGLEFWQKSSLFVQSIIVVFNLGIIVAALYWAWLTFLA